ncbi:MAG: hypothetical protein LUG95_01400 [Clostridiales bacterium]|nr:hypothetical protein [Clostridiales bacterium]
MFKLLNKAHSVLLVPFAVSSFLFAAAEIFSVISKLDIWASFYSLLTGLAELFVGIVPFVFCFFITLVTLKGKRGFKAFWSLFCFSVAYTCISAFLQSDYSFVVGVVIALLCIYCFNNFSPVFSLAATFSVSVILGVLFGYLADYFANFIMWLTDFVSGKNIISCVLFALIYGIFSLFNISSFADAFYNKSHGGSLLFDGEIVTGTAELFASSYDGKLVSFYLSGHYFMLFASVDITAALCTQLKGAQKIILIAVTVGTVFSGNIFSSFTFRFSRKSVFVFLCSYDKCAFLHQRISSRFGYRICPQRLCF